MSSTIEKATTNLFPTHLPSGEFVQFAAGGFTSPGCGLIHRRDFPARNGMPLGGDLLPGYWGEAGVHFPSSIMLAATCLYHGDRIVGLELAERTVRALVIENRASWDSILLFRGDNAEFLWGADYYQNTMLWSLPAAIAGTDLAGTCESDGLVSRITAAAREGK
ncbi:MAG: hypothetical protein HY318_15840 [Armatimonadetes bacterium]|nr:hypothetical protein [Armatimonadota bacterium]